MSGVTFDGGAFEVGQRVEWLYTAPAGYGFTARVPATVLAIRRERVTIAAELAKGGVKNVSVKPENLRHRSSE